MTKRQGLKPSGPYKTAMQHAAPYCVAMTLPAALLIFCHGGECAAQAHGAY